MLKNLQIKNVALVEEADIEFSSGLNVLSGETGSGKSVILDSLNFVLGAKADKSMIRNGKDFCQVKAVFDVTNNSAVKSELESLDIDDDDTLIISRKFSVSGSSSVKINGEPVSINGLKKVTRHLVDVHGQSEHFYLLKESNQLALIDAFGGETIEEIKRKLSEETRKLKKVNAELNELGGDDGQRAIRLDILTYQFNEIREADVKDGEYEELLTLKAKLNNQEKISEALNEMRSCLEAEGGAVDGVSYAKTAASKISSYAPEYAEILSRLENVYVELDDISQTVYGYSDDFEFSQGELERVEERLSVIKNLYKKYGSGYDELENFAVSAEREIDKLKNFDVLAENLLKEKNALIKTVYGLYSKLSSARETVAKEFSSQVVREIRELNMKNAAFEVYFNDLPEPSDNIALSDNGLDEVSFMFSANLGEPVKPLSKIISGGEMSRFMLAVKSKTAKYSEIETLVFDEIDAGISGETAKIVGQKFVNLSKDVQIIAVSHLPQIVVLGDQNLLIEKIETEGKTVSTINTIQGEELLNEIVRLIGGDSLSASARAHAEATLNAANELKKEYKKR